MLAWQKWRKTVSCLHDVIFSNTIAVVVKLWQPLLFDVLTILLHLVNLCLVSVAWYGPVSEHLISTSHADLLEIHGYNFFVYNNL